MRSGWAPDARRSAMEAPAAAATRRSDESGTGVVASVFGVGVFLALLMLAVQVAFVLYARSTVSAAAFDAARLVSGATAASSGPSGLASSEAAATAHLRALLGGYGDRAVVEWSVGAQEVSVTVTMRLPMLLPIGIPGGSSLADVRRTVVLQRELVS